MEIPEPWTTPTHLLLSYDLVMTSCARSRVSTGACTRQFGVLMYADGKGVLLGAYKHQEASSGCMRADPPATQHLLRNSLIGLCTMMQCV